MQPLGGRFPPEPADCRPACGSAGFFISAVVKRQQAETEAFTLDVRE